MKTRYLIIFFCFFIFIGMGCKEDDSPVGSTQVASFDLSLGKSWTYRWMMTMSDTAGSIISSRTDTVVVHVASINDSIGDFDRLIRLEAQSIPHFVGVTKVWYQFAGDSLVEIAYSNAGSVPFVLPKCRTIANKNMTIIPPSFSLFPHLIMKYMELKGIQDSTIIREDMRIVYTFPLVNGRKWTSFTNPFLQTREIIGTELLERAGKSFHCVKILTALPVLAPDIEWYDYVSREGLIERKIQIDSLAITTPENPVVISYYGSAFELLELIN